MARGTAGAETWGQEEPGKACKVHVAPNGGWREFSRPLLTLGKDSSVIPVARA